MNLETTNRMFALSEKYRSLKSEVGTPMARNTGSGNLIEPISKGHVPSLKKQPKPISDDEIKDMERRVMPEKAKAREQYRQRWIGKQVSLQTW